MVVSLLRPLAKLEPDTSYNIIVDSGIINGSGTSYNYKGLFKTKGISPVWSPDSVLSVNNILQESLTLNWPAASADAGVKSFEIFQGAVSLGKCDVSMNRL